MIASALARLMALRAGRIIDQGTGQYDARQAIYAVHHHGIAFTHEGEQRIEFRPQGVFARCLVGEHLVHLDPLKLAIRVLIEAADPHAPDALILQGCLLRKGVRKKSINLYYLCQ